MRAEGPDRSSGGDNLRRVLVVADRGDAGTRLDLVLQRHLGGPQSVSRQRVQDAIRQGRAWINRVETRKVATRVANGDRIEVDLPEDRREPPAPQRLPLDVIFEDDHLLAVNKPAGMVVHPAYKHRDATLLNAVLWHVRRGAEAETAAGEGRASAGVDPPRLLHRLDKDTSGIVLLSKTRAAHSSLVSAMRAGKVRKQYLAIVEGVPRPASGTITLPLGRDRRDHRRVTVDLTAGRDCATRYEVLAAGRRARVETPGAGGRSTHRSASRVTLVLCELVTGRTHQIRVHLAARGWPIVGDRVYGTWDRALAGLHGTRDPALAGLYGTPDPASAGLRGPSHAFPRQALHAWRLTFPHPVTGAPLVLTAPIPDDTRRLMKSTGLDIDQRLTTRTNDEDQRPTTSGQQPTTND